MRSIMLSKSIYLGLAVFTLLFMLHFASVVANATPIRYHFGGTGNVTFDPKNELGLGGNFPKTAFFGSFYFDSQSPSNELLDMKFRFGSYSFTSREATPWLTPNALYSSTFTSTLSPLLNDHWYEINMELLGLYTYDLSTFLGGDLFILCATTEQDRRGEVEMEGKIEYLGAAPVPEPQTLVLLSAGLLGLLGNRRYRKH